MVAIYQLGQALSAVLCKVAMMQRHTNLLAVVPELIVCMACSLCYLRDVDVEY